MRRQPIRRKPKQAHIKSPVVRRPSSNRVKSQKQHIAQATTEVPKYSPGGATKKIAIVQGGAWGDNINSTLMLIPLKEHFKDSIIDIHTSNLYYSAFYNNPYINKIIKYNVGSKNDAISLAQSIPKRLAESNYDIIAAPHPIYHHDKWSCLRHPEWGENLIFAWVRAIEDLSIPYDKLETVLRLTHAEVKRAKAAMTKVPEGRKNVLMEIHGESGQTPWNPHWTKIVGEYLCRRGCNLLISHKDMRADIEYLRSRYRSQVHWVGNLSIRECAELYNRSHVFISVSSGLSNACNTDWCSRANVKWFEVMNSITCSSAAIRSEGKTFWHGTLDGFIELLKESEL